MTDIIERLFGNAVKPKLIRTFISNPLSVLDSDTLTKKIRSRSPLVKKEITSLLRIGFLKKKIIKNASHRKVNGFCLNQNFVFLSPLRDFMMRMTPFTDAVIAKKISSIGRVRLVVLSGMFMNNSESRLDLLVVADHPNEKKLKKVLEDMEGEFGKEISFALFSTEDFHYRKQMGDKLIRDVFDFGHIIIVDRMNIKD